MNVNQLEFDCICKLNSPYWLTSVSPNWFHWLELFEPLGGKKIKKGDVHWNTPFSIILQSDKYRLYIP